MSDNNSFSSSLGAIMAAVGSAVGLGNIWRFPYICGKYGGGAFLLVYLLFVFFIGMVLLISEFVIGRRSLHAPVKAYSSLRPDRSGWKCVGVIGIISCFFILSQYLVISGWTLNYFVDSCTGAISSLGTDLEAIKTHFVSFSAGVGRPILFLAIFGILTATVILGGVQKGIEAVSKILMPLLLVILLVLCVRSLTLPNASKGLAYLFSPDFSKLSGEGILAALGQALFTLSVGMGVMIVYGSYIPKDDNLFKTALWITASDTVIAIMAGIAIFPAVFSCGLEPQGGPGLVFNVLPAVFNTMGGIGTVCSALFFLLLVTAALTSAISMLEALVAWISETVNINRKVSTVLFISLTMLAGVACSLSNGVWSNVHILGDTIFDFVDCLNSIYLLPVCALGTILFYGWVMPKKDVIDELSNQGKFRIAYFRVMFFLARYVIPVILVAVLYFGIRNKIMGA